MGEKKTYFPAKTFDDDLVTFTSLAKEQKWVFSGVDFKQLEKDVEEQRKARAAFEKLEAQYLKAKEEFGIAQEARYERFATALNAARGAFQKDRATMASLEPFKRSTRPAKKKEPTT